MTFRRAWDGDGWQAYVLQLVQLRHKPQNVQTVPDRVRGDAGIEFFSTDGCLYQCYAPEEIGDTAKAASAMKAKASRDLQKLVTFQKEIAKLLQCIKAKRWILLCPFLDDKDVVAFVRQKGEMIKKCGVSFVSDDFEALVQSQQDFVSELGQLRLLSLGPSLQIPVPSEDDVRFKSDGEITSRLVEKLTRAFPRATASQIETRKIGYIRAHLLRENALDLLREDHALLWERSIRCLDAEESRLIALGSGSGHPGQQLMDSVARIEDSLVHDLPDLPRSVITQIALGTISDWLFRCPLDFPSWD